MAISTNPFATGFPGDAPSAAVTTNAFSSGRPGNSSSAHVSLHTRAVRPDDHRAAWNAFLIGLGDAEGIPGLYDGFHGIMLGTGVAQLDDARGASGFGPALTQSTAGAQPAYDARTGTLTFDGTNDVLESADSSAFPLSATASLWLAVIGSNSADDLTNFRYTAALRNSAQSVFFGVGVASGDSTLGARGRDGTSNRDVDFGVASGDTIRLMIVGVQSGQPVRAECFTLDGQTSSSALGTISDQASLILSAGWRFAPCAVRTIAVGIGAYPTTQQLAALRMYAIARGVAPAVGDTA